MAEYIVIKPWFGVQLHQRIELEPPVHPSLVSHVRPVGFVTEGANIEQLSPSIELPGGTIGEGSEGDENTHKEDVFDWESVRAEVIAELEAAGIDFNEEAAAIDLADLLDEEVREGIRLAAE